MSNQSILNLAKDISLTFFLLGPFRCNFQWMVAYIWGYRLQRLDIVIASEPIIEFFMVLIPKRRRLGINHIWFRH